MPAIDKIDMSGSVVGEQQLTDGMIEDEINTGLLHEVIRAEEAAVRAGTASAKSRSMVRASGAKPWRQKGVGRARAGSASMPQWTGGGVVFPPTPRDHSFKVNKRAHGKAYRQALGSLVLNGRASVLAAGFEEPSTKKAMAVLEGRGLETPLLVVASSGEVTVEKSFRNIPGVIVAPVSQVGVRDYVWARNVVFTEGAVSVLEGGEV